jgi:transposase
VFVTTSRTEKGELDREPIVALLAEGLSVEAIGRRLGQHPSTVADWMAEHGLEAHNREKHAAKGGVDRVWLQTKIEEGLSIAQLAEAAGLSKTAVRYWLARYGLRTAAAQRASATRRARQADVHILPLKCAIHGETDFVLEGRGYYRCLLCRQERVSRRRRAAKATLVAEAGGRCALCGYDRCARALQFHHVDPSKKRHTVCNDGRTIAIDALRAEAEKCILLCANCHAEVEAGATILPLEFAPGEVGAPGDGGPE